MASPSLYAHWMTINYRESYGIFGASGILFNHESPLRGLEFVTRKITDSFAKIKLGQLDVLTRQHGCQRDWATRANMSRACGACCRWTSRTPTCSPPTARDGPRLRDDVGEGVGFDLAWKGKDEQRFAVDMATGRTLVRSIRASTGRRGRPADRDAAKAKAKLGWEAKTTLEELCRLMVEADLKRNAIGQSF